MRLITNIRDGEKGGGGKRVWRWGKREIIYLLLRVCHHQNDFCIKMGSDESHFITVRDKVTRQCPQTSTFEQKGEPKQIQTEVLLLTSLKPYR